MSSLALPSWLLKVPIMLATTDTPLFPPENRMTTPPQILQPSHLPPRDDN